jgi:CO/xanthine dehydrogenase FAD-binding subunit
MHEFRLHRPATVDEAVTAHSRAQDPLYLAVARH